MTHEEKIIVSAYTEYMMVTNFSEIQAYVQEKLGRPIYTHEFADSKVSKEIHEAVREDFVNICKKDTNPLIHAYPIFSDTFLGMGKAKCSNCNTYSIGYDMDGWDNYCRCCGAKMDGEPDD